MGLREVWSGAGKRLIAIECHLNRSIVDDTCTPVASGANPSGAPDTLEMPMSL